MAKDKKTISVPGWFTHEGKILEPGKEYVVTDDPDNSENSLEISQRAFDDLTKQIDKFNKAAEKKAQEDEANRRAMYGETPVDTGTPGTGLSTDDVKRMINEAVAAALAQRDAEKIEETGTDNQVNTQGGPVAAENQSGDNGGPKTQERKLNTQ